MENTERNSSYVFVVTLSDLRATVKILLLENDLMFNV